MPRIMLQHGFFDNGERLKSVLIIVNSQPIENIWFVADLQSRCKIASTCFGCSNVASEPRIAESIRFGENFELDLRAYALRRSGRPLKLERLPMELLILLVEQRGQLVTREEIIGRIWGKDVFLDTDNSINAAIRKIRQVLKDDPEQPRFVQTITGRGYRFIATVAESRPFPTPKAGARILSTESSVGSNIPANSGAVRKNAWKTSILPIAVVVAGMIGSILYYRSQQTTWLTD